MMFLIVFQVLQTSKPVPLHLPISSIQNYCKFEPVVKYNNTWYREIDVESIRYSEDYLSPVFLNLENTLTTKYIGVVRSETNSNT